MYRLVDPRTGETFYVGKGKDNRVFDHLRGQLRDDEDFESEKMNQIREIRQAMLEPIAIIHRHGLSEDEAFHVEATLIDAYPGLTNVQSGHGDTGVRHVDEIVRQYQAPIADLDPEKLKVVLININRSSSESVSAYKAVHHAWRIDKEKANQADYVVAVNRGIIEGVFIVDPPGWISSNQTNFPDALVHIEGRSGFHGRAAPDTVASKLIGRQVPDNVRHVRNPIRYNWPLQENGGNQNMNEERRIEVEVTAYTGNMDSPNSIRFVAITLSSASISAATIADNGIAGPSLESKRRKLIPKAVSQQVHREVMDLSTRLTTNWPTTKTTLQEESAGLSAVHPQFLTLRIITGDTVVGSWEGPIGIGVDEGLIGELKDMVTKITKE